MLGLVTEKSLREAEAEVADLKTRLQSAERFSADATALAEETRVKFEAARAELGKFQGLATQRGDALATVAKERDAQAQLVDRLNGQVEILTQRLDQARSANEAQVRELQGRVDAAQSDLARFRGAFDSECQEHAKTRSGLSQARQERSEAVSTHARLLEAHTSLQGRFDEIQASQAALHRSTEESLQSLTRERDAWRQEAQRAQARGA